MIETPSAGGTGGGPVLAIDTSMAACSVAAGGAGTAWVWRSRSVGRGHAGCLAPMIAEVMAAAGLRYGDLGLLAAAVGPGSYTGLRIGLATVRGIALAAGLPVAGVSTLAALAAGMAAGSAGAGPAAPGLLVVTDTGRDDVYAQPFDGRGRPLCPAAALPMAGLADLVRARIGGAGAVPVGGDLAAPALAALRQAGIRAVAGTAAAHPDIRLLARMAAEDAAAGRSLPAVPLYLRPPAVTLPATGRPGGPG